MRILWLGSEKSGEKPGSEVLLRADCVDDPLQALGALRGAAYDAVLADFPIPGWTAGEWLEEAQRIHSTLPIIVREPNIRINDAIRLVKVGAFDVVDNLDEQDVAGSLERAAEHQRGRQLALFGSPLANDEWKRFLVGESAAMRQIAEVVRLIAARRCTVLITGETGTGKEMVARAVHAASGRGHLPLVAVNCSALPEHLLEAELFGHVKGAFTGAVNHRVGRFEQAHRSTLFLDEIADMPLDLQAKLLRVLQERELQRLGSSETIRLDVRVLAASNVELTERIRQGRFREDLYYRLNVVPVRVPALRERLADIPLLVHHFVEKICRQENLPPKAVSREALERLGSYSWPGNVRQLENAVEMAIALAGDRRQLYPGDFPLPSRAEHKPPASSLVNVRVPDDGLDFESTISRIEMSILNQALERTGGNKKQAAEILRLKRTTLSAKLKSLALAGA